MTATKWSRALVQGKIVEKYTLETAPTDWDVRFYQGHPGHGSRGYIKVMISIGPSGAETLTLETHARGVDAEGAKELVMRLIELLQATKGSGFAVQRRAPKIK